MEVLKTHELSRARGGDSWTTEKSNELRALVYGGTRHLGAAVAASLEARGYIVDIVDFGTAESDDVSVRPSGVHSPRINLLRTSDAASFAPDRLVVDAGAYDVVLFCGVETLPWALTKVSADYLDAEVQLLATLLAQRPKRFVLTSSASVYAPTEASLIDESAPIDPASTLGRHARTLELLILRADEGPAAMPHVILRCAAIVGASASAEGRGRVLKADLFMGNAQISIDYPEMVIARGLPGGQEPCSACGMLTPRDAVYIDDVAEAHIRAAQVLADGGGGWVLNVGTGVPVSAPEVLSSAERLEGVTVGEGWPDLASSARGPALATARAGEVLDWTPSLERRRQGITEEIDALVARKLSEREREMRRGIRISHEFIGSRLTKRGLTITGLLLVRDKTGTFANSRVRFQVADAEYTGRVFTTRGVRVPFKHVHVSPYRFTLPRECLWSLPTHSPVRLVHTGVDGTRIEEPLGFSFFRRAGRHHRGRLHFLRGDGAGDTTVYVRQAGKNMRITTRVRNRTDSPAMLPKIYAARLAAFLIPRRGVLLYEKNGSQYEESASVLFERLIDRGHRGARFVLAREMMERVPEKYRPYIVPRFSFLHFYHVFCARDMVGTEGIAHGVELRTAVRMLLRRIYSADYQYVFLQHGVMYMVSLNSSERAAFRAGGVMMPWGSKVVCSSALEAKHFVDYGGFDPGDLYITGLPKFDRAVRHDDADRILVMPTWRPWEYNAIRSDPSSTGYYRMMKEMLAAIPKHLSDRVLLLPHPLIRPALVGTELEDRVGHGDSYDSALRRCSLLITDYSSISYDAFYRGANVVFWWKEKDECMQRYNAHLMIDEATAFGPACYRPSELSASVEALADSPQDARYVARYREIVEFHDNRNTDRLIDAMERDGLL